MIEVLVSVLIFLILVALFWWAVTSIMAVLPIPEPIRTVIHVVLVVILVIVLIYALMSFLPVGHLKLGAL